MADGQPKKITPLRTLLGGEDINTTKRGKPVRSSTKRLDRAVLPISKQNVPTVSAVGNVSVTVWPL